MNSATGRADLGRVVGWLQLSIVPYETYLQGQKLVASYLTQLNRSAVRLTSVSLFLFAFAATFYITSSITRRYAAVVLLILALGSVLTWTLWSYRRAQLYKRIYYSLDQVNSELCFGENGLYIETSSLSLLFCWSDLAVAVKNKHGLFLIMKNLQVISIPEGDLNRMPQADALLEFVVRKGSSPAFDRNTKFLDK